MVCCQQHSLTVPAALTLHLTSSLAALSYASMLQYSVAATVFFQAVNLEGPFAWCTDYGVGHMCGVATFSTFRSVQ